ncbi:hypothetical protein ACFV4K_33025 [Nocardia sp. NPDC059764]
MHAGSFRRLLALAAVTSAAVLTLPSAAWAAGSISYPKNIS